ncbi:hypothetical protein DRQ20_06840 [bacterium]|nr:MAG: hypothetical protein DRQ20_06840 [bacterium]
MLWLLFIPGYNPDVSWDRGYGFEFVEEGGFPVKGAFSSLSGFDSLNVTFVGNWPFGPSYAVTVDTVRSLVFLGSGGGVYVVDGDNPESLLYVGEIRTRGVVYGLFYDENTQRLYIADGPGGLEIWDVSTPSAPQKMGSYFTPDYANGVFISGNYAYVADGWKGLRIVDISNPSSPYEVGYYNTPGYAEGVFVSGNYAYVADRYSGLRVIDVSDPYSPQEVGYYDTPGSAWGVFVSGDYAYVADGGAGLRVIDISDPSSPYEVGYYDTPDYAYGVFVSGNYAYVADWYSGLRVIKIAP